MIGLETKDKQERQETRHGGKAEPMHDKPEQVAEPEASQGKQALAQMSATEQAFLVRNPQVFGAQRAEAMLGLQQTHGNRYVQRLVAGASEHSVTESPLVRKAEEENRRGEVYQISPDIARRIDQQRPSGEPLDSATRGEMEAKFGRNLSGVRVHRNQKADQLARAVDASAFTAGRDMFFRDGTYAPGSQRGKELLAHELTHALQYSPEVVANSQTPKRAALWRQQEPAGGEPGPPTTAEGGEPEMELMALRMRMLGLISELCGLRESFFNNYVDLGILVTDILKTRLMIVSGDYKAAYDRYASVVRAARQEAQSQQEWIDIFVGIGIGVGLGVAALTIPVAAGVSAGGVAVTVGTEVTEAAVGLGVKKTGVLEVAGKELEPGGLDPYLLRSKFWERLAKMYRGLHDVRPVQNCNTLLWVVTEKAIGEAKLYLAGAETAIPQDKLTEIMLKIIKCEKTMEGFASGFEKRMETLNAVGTKAVSAPVYPAWEMQQDIWIMWISTLSYGQSDILDLDAIEDHLFAIGVIGPGSRLGVDFGDWTSKEDEVNAIMAALRKAHDIEARYRAIAEGTL